MHEADADNQVFIDRFSVMHEANAHNQVFIDRHLDFLKEFLQDDRLSRTELLRLVVQDRLRRLFPNDEPADLAKVDAYWVDLPERLLYDGELNLMHEPSIFNSSDFTPHQRVLESLTLPFAIRFVLQWLVNRKVPEDCMDLACVAKAAWHLNARDAHILPHVALEKSCLFTQDGIKLYPRSLIKSPQRNAGVLFRAPVKGEGERLLWERFSSAAAGRDYFRERLARAPAVPRYGQLLFTDVRPLSHLYAPTFSSISLEHLSLDERHVWCQPTRANHNHHLCKPSECQSPPRRRRLLSPFVEYSPDTPGDRSHETPGSFGHINIIEMISKAEQAAEWSRF